MSLRRLLLCSALLASFQSGSPTIADAQSAPVTANAIELQPGDALRISVWRQPELSGEFLIASDGAIAHPLYKDIRVVGRPLSAVEAQLTEFLRRFVESPRFVVEPLLRVTVSGEVNRPNVFAVPPSTTLAQALAQAGGANERGRRDRVRLVRNQGERFVNLTDPRQGRVTVHSGDEILVERQGQWFRNVLVPAATILGAAASVLIAIRRNN